MSEQNLLFEIRKGLREELAAKPVALQMSGGHSTVVKVRYVQIKANHAKVRR